MAIRPRYKTNNRLPSATLYLDDVERIVEILKNSVPEDISRPGPDAASANPRWASFRFIVGEDECDSVEDLREIGRVTRRFGIVGVWFELRMDGNAAEIHAVGREGINQELRGRLLLIFEGRRKKAPASWFFNGWFLLLLFCAVILAWEILVAKWTKPALHSFSRQVQGLIEGALAALPFGLMLPGYNLAGALTRLLPAYSTVVLRYRRDPVPESARWMPQKHELVKILVGAVLGWVLGLLTSLLFQRK